MRTFSEKLLVQRHIGPALGRKFRKAKPSVGLRQHLKSNVSGDGKFGADEVEDIKIESSGGEKAWRPS